MVLFHLLIYAVLCMHYMIYVSSLQLIQNEAATATRRTCRDASHSPLYCGLSSRMIPTRRKLQGKFYNSRLYRDSRLLVIPESAYVPPEVGPEIWTVQRRCLVCKGSGLTMISRQGSVLSRPRKCWSCGGFIPWLGWKRFLSTSVEDPGNGGPLQRPARDFEATNKRIQSGEFKLPEVSLEDYYNGKLDKVKETEEKL